VAEMPF